MSSRLGWVEPCSGNRGGTAAEASLSVRLCRGLGRHAQREASAAVLPLGVHRPPP